MPGVHIQAVVNWASHTRRDWTTYMADRVNSPAPFPGVIADIVAASRACPAGSGVSDA